MPPAPSVSSALPLRDGPVLAWGLPLLSLLIAWLNRPDDLSSQPGPLLTHWLVSLLFTASYWLSDRALWFWLLRQLPRPAQTVRRLWALAGAAGLLAGAITAGLLLVLHLGQPAWFPLTVRTWLLTTRFSLIPTTLVLTLYEAAYFFKQWQANLRRADQLAQAATQAQLDALTRQLDPHFLFNSLNTLAALIEPTNEPAQHYLESLADLYRYVLLARTQPTVPLAEELAFARTYLALQQVRFGASLHLDWQVPAVVPAGRVAPLSVQELLENALKHNEASRARPLTLTVQLVAGHVQVAHPHQPRPAGLVPGTGTGLANLRRRYALLGAPGPVEAGVVAGCFVARLPVLPPLPGPLAPPAAPTLPAPA